MYFVFIIKTRHKSLFHDYGKITQKEISIFFSCDYLTSRRNVEKRLIISTEVSIQSRKKMIDFDYYEKWLTSTLYQTKYYYGSV